MSLFGNFFGKFSRDLGIDLGTVNTVIYTNDKGIVINQPSIVALNNKTNQVISVGKEALEMVGKTPPYITIVRPIIRGIISDFEAAEKMIKYFIDRLHEGSFSIVPRPRIVIGVPIDVTEVERKAVEDAALSAGAREVFLVEQPMLGAIGARMPIEEPIGNMIVNIGGGRTEIAVIALSGIVTWRSLAIAGEELNKNIIQFARDEFNLLLGERMAEHVKMSIGTAKELSGPIEIEMRGRDLGTGLPKEVKVNDGQVRRAIQKSIRAIVDNIKATIESTPPELVADIYERGIVLIGGGANIRGIDAFFVLTILGILDQPINFLRTSFAAVYRPIYRLSTSINASARNINRAG